MKLLRLLRLVFSPFKQIAADLRIIRELYELELSSRNPPIMRITEKPDPKHDTEVLTDGVADDSLPFYKRWTVQPEEEDE